MSRDSSKHTHLVIEQADNPYTRGHFLWSHHNPDTPKMPIILNANTLIRFVGSSDRW
jgi:hypothetical protein